MPHEAWQNVRRLLAVRLDNIGDAVLLSPALRALKSELPNSSITLAATKACAQAVPMLPWVDDVMVWRPVWQDVDQSVPLDPARETALIEDLRKGAFDAAIVFTSFSQSPHVPAYVCYLAGIGLRAAQSKEFGGSVCSHWVKPPPDEYYQAERNLHLLRGLGFAAERSELELHLPRPARTAAGRLLSEAGISEEQDYVVVVPGAGCDARRYPAEKFAAAAVQLARGSKLPIVVLGSEHDCPAFLDRRSELEKDGVRVLAGRTDVPQYAAVIARSALVVANNSSALHLAEAFRIPVLALYSGTDLEQQWRPRNTRCRILARRTPCSPCYLLRCAFSKECLEISPEEAAAAGLSLLKESRPEGRTAAKRNTVCFEDFYEAA